MGEEGGGWRGEGEGRREEGYGRRVRGERKREEEGGDDGERREEGGWMGRKGQEGKSVNVRGGPRRGRIPQGRVGRERGSRVHCRTSQAGAPVGRADPDGRDGTFSQDSCVNCEEVLSESAIPK